jgi:hypothetical protein
MRRLNRKQLIWNGFKRKVIVIQLVVSSTCYGVFHGFGQVKFAYGGLGKGSSQFLLLSQLPQKMTLVTKMFNKYLKIIILLCQFKSVTHSVKVWAQERQVK